MDQKRQTGYQLREAAGDYWLINMEQRGLPFEKPLMLNQCGALIWKEYSEGKAIGEIARTLQQTYGIELAEAEADVKDFIGQLKVQGIE